MDLNQRRQRYRAVLAGARSQEGIQAVHAEVSLPSLLGGAGGDLADLGPNLASAELMAQVTRRADYERWTQEILS